jgi:hypothetical protein
MEIHMTQPILLPDALFLQSLCPHLTVKPTLSPRVLGTQLIIRFDNLGRSPLDRDVNVEAAVGTFMEWFREHVGEEGVEWGLQYYNDWKIFFRVRDERIAMRFKLRFF